LYPFIKKLLGGVVMVSKDKYKNYKRAAAYLRKSRDEPSKTESGEDILEEQKRIIDKLKMKLGIEVDTFEEIESGSTISGRKEFKKLLNYCRSGYYDVIICKDITRLTRGSYKDMGEVNDLVELKGVDIVTDDEVFSRDDPSSLRYMRMLLSFSREEWEMTRSRLFGGRLASAEKGHWLTPRSTPFGYVYDKQTKKLKPDPTTADYVKQIFKWYVDEELTIHWISNKLESLKVKTTRGNSIWHPSTVGKILKNKVYIGTVEYNKSKWYLEYDEIKGKEINKKVTKKEKDWIIVENAHPPLIDKETFEKAQIRLNARSSSAPVPSEQELGELARLVVCPGCGKYLIKSFWVREYKKKDGTSSFYPKHYLVCNRKTRKTIPECGYNWRYEDVLETVLEELKKISISDKHLKKYYDATDFTVDESKETELSFLKEELKREEKRMDIKRTTFFKYLEQGEEFFYPKSTFERDMRESIQKIENIKKEIERIKSERKISFKEGKKYAKEKIKNALDLYYTVETREERNEILHSLIHHIDVTMVEKARGRKEAVIDVAINLYPELWYPNK
jgi:site-specific DNA recombinase